MAIDTFVQKKLRALREKNNLTLEQLANKLDTTPITLSRYETGKRSVSLCILEEICKIYNLTIPEFFAHNIDDLPLIADTASTSAHISQSLQSIFVYGEIAAGAFTDAHEEFIDEIEIPSSLSSRYGNNNLFGLSVKGNSMNNIVQNGDYVVLHRQSNANNGDVVAVLLDGQEATLKRFYQLDPETIILKPESSDSAYQPITVDLRQENSNLQILGKMVWHCAAYTN